MCVFNFSFKYKDYFLNISEKNTNIIVKSKNTLCYQNELNAELKFPEKFTAKDFNLFFITLFYIQKKFKSKTKRLKLNFEDFTQYLKDGAYKNKNRFYKEICSFFNKAQYICSSIQNTDKNSKDIDINTFFTKIFISNEKKEIELEISSVAYDYLFFFKQFTKIDLYEFCSIDKIGAKGIYRILLEFKNLANFDKKSSMKCIFFTKEEFMVRLNCYNETYKNSLGAFDKLIIKPAIKELEKGYFKKIVCNKIKNNPYDKKQITGFQLLYDDSNRNQVK